MEPGLKKCHQETMKGELSSEELPVTLSGICNQAYCAIS